MLSSSLRALKHQALCYTELTKETRTTLPALREVLPIAHTNIIDGSGGAWALNVSARSETFSMANWMVLVYTHTSEGPNYHHNEENKDPAYANSGHCVKKQ